MPRRAIPCHAIRSISSSTYDVLPALPCHISPSIYDGLLTMPYPWYISSSIYDVLLAMPPNPARPCPCHIPTSIYDVLLLPETIEKKKEKKERRKKTERERETERRREREVERTPNLFLHHCAKSLRVNQLASIPNQDVNIRVKAERWLSERRLTRHVPAQKTVQAPLGRGNLHRLGQISD